MKRKQLLPFVAVLLIAWSLCAQQVTETSKRPSGKPPGPGDVLKFEVTFKGDHADQIKQIILILSRPGQLPEDQRAGFTNNFNSGWVQKPTPEKFILSMKIPNNIATGDYIMEIEAQTGDATIIYDRGQIGLPPIHIENPAKFIPPKITVIEKQ